MKRIFYYTTTAIIISCGISQAQTCVPTPTCSTLGYTSTTACDGGLKCPFGEAWNCTNSDLSNKITELEKKLEQQQQQEECVIGSILYSDMTCSVTVFFGKTPIGIVVYTDGQGHGQAMALKYIGVYEWGSYGKDISNLQNLSAESEISKDYDSCSNTAKIVAAGDSSKYPAAWAAHEYSTEGTNAGDWCLPAAGIFTSYYNNRDAINAGFSRANGIQITDGTSVWSSSEYSSNYAWVSCFNYSYGLKYSKEDKDFTNMVRPVLEF